MCGKKVHVQHVESGKWKYGQSLLDTDTPCECELHCMYVVHVLACVPSSKKRRLHTITRTIHVTIHNQQ